MGVGATMVLHTFQKIQPARHYTLSLRTLPRLLPTGFSALQSNSFWLLLVEHRFARLDIFPAAHKPLGEAQHPTEQDAGHERLCIEIVARQLGDQLVGPVVLTTHARSRPFFMIRQSPPLLLRRPRPHSGEGPPGKRPATAAGDQIPEHYKSHSFLRVDGERDSETRSNTRGTLIQNARIFRY